jgi:hypothetical protein
MLTKNYNQIRIQRFLAQRVDLKSFCFILKNRYKSEYDFQELEGTIPSRKSESLVKIAASRKELGHLVFHIVQYWLDDVHGNPDVLKEEKLNEELAIFLKEIEKKGGLDEIARVKEMLGIIGPRIDPPPVGQFEHGYAVLVGVGEHRNPRILPLSATIKDVRAIREVLIDPTRCGYLEDHIHLLTGPAATRHSILSSMDWLADKAKQDKAATAIFYFSGHGWKDKSRGSLRYRLIPYDCDLNKAESTTISDNHFTKKLRSIGTDRLVVILDACHAGGMTMTKTPAPLPKGFEEAPPPTSILERLGSGSGKVILSSARENELSYIRNDNSRSIFTHCLIEALSGQASGSHPGQIGILDVFTYLDQHVPVALKTGQYKDPRTGEPARQHPILDSKQANNFPIALVPGRKGKEK